jgi:hypothetical protein
MSATPLARLKKLTDSTCAETTLPSRCKFSGERGLLGFHSAYQAWLRCAP